jgi:hypothetical protein
MYPVPIRSGLGEIRGLIFLTGSSRDGVCPIVLNERFIFLR